ncbi:hypothetical protein [Natrinema sp. SYSU A 869]|uniref:hypothetical protein n=1 Tax=Natrinema sp. SYSU A 869 TaxID=2871694 RepID=UPI001CA41B16|nr:hypothetical protein [Natrinema sp. SYSU A 869]
MTTRTSLPAIDDCLEAYLAAHADFGAEPFSSADLADRVDGFDPSEPTGAHRLDLLIAYGLVDRIGDDRYRIRCRPDESVARWQERSVERAATVRRLVADRTAGHETPSNDPEPLSHDGDSFASVFVSEQDDVETVATTAAAALARDASLSGIVLRGAGSRADHLQQITDELCNSDVVEHTDLEQSFEKVVSDVVGESKDTLEFRSFLRITQTAES